MMLKVRFLMCLVLLSVFTIGCGGGGEARNATDGASKSAIEEYEAAVKAAEGSMETKEETAPVEAASPTAEPAAQ